MIELLKTNWRLAAVLLVCYASFFTGWHWRGVSFEAAQADQLRQLANARRKQEEDDRKASAALQIRLAALETHARDLNRRLAHELQKPAYRCPVPDDGLRLISDAIHAPSR